MKKTKILFLGFYKTGPPLFKTLRNIATGITAGKEVTADRARDVGCKILTNMVGQNVGDHSFKKKDHVVTMSHKQSVKVDGENVNVDPQLLFQRLVIAAGDDLDVAENFKYELSTHPSALFEPNGLMREADKPALADAIWNTAKATEMPKPSNREEMNYVLDGGALIQRLPWSHMPHLIPYVTCMLTMLSKSMETPLQLCLMDMVKDHLRRILLISGDLVVLWV